MFLWKAITGMSFFYLSILIYFAYLVNQELLRTSKTQRAQSIPILTEDSRITTTKKSPMERTVEFTLSKKMTLSPMYVMRSSIFLLLLMRQAGLSKH